jgi:hypothetical protein
MNTKNNKYRISINKLAEYMSANTLRRKQIVKDAKTPKKFIIARYSEARNAIKSYVISGFDADILTNCIISLEKKKPETPYQEDDTRNSIRALESLLSADIPDIEGCSIDLFTSDNKLVTLKGLDISVNPDLVIKDNESGRIGGMKIHISKGSQLSDDGRMYVATMLKYFHINCGVAEKEIEDKLCISMDVFGASYSTSPKAYKRTLHAIEAACEEIVSRWDSLD